MRYLKLLIALSLTCMLHASPAAAADWSGLYVGVNRASETLQGEWTTTETRNSLGLETEPSSDTEAAFEDEVNDDGMRLGLSANPGNWVWSLEAVKASVLHENSIEDRIPGLGDGSSQSPSHVDFRAESDAVNLRLRSGYLVMPQLLFYVTAGKVELDVDVTSVCSEGDNVCDEGTPSHANEKTLSDTAVGIGLEYQLYGFMLRAEYIEADYGEFSFTALPDQPTISNGADATLAIKTELMQIGLGYQF